MTLAEFMISGDWLVAALLALIPVMGGVWVKAKQAGAKQAGEVTLKEPVPEVPVKRVYAPPSFAQHMDLVRRVDRVEGDVRDLRKDQADQFRKLLEVGEERKDKIFDKIDSMQAAIHKRINQIVAEKQGSNPTKKNS